MAQQRVIRQEAKTDTDSDFDEIIETETDNDLSRILNMGLINNPKQLEIDEELLERIEEYLKFESGLAQKRREIAHRMYAPFFCNESFANDDGKNFDFEIVQNGNTLKSISIRIYAAVSEQYFFIYYTDFKRVAFICGEKAALYLEDDDDKEFVDFLMWINHKYEKYEYNQKSKKITVEVQ